MRKIKFNNKAIVLKVLDSKLEEADKKKVVDFINRLTKNNLYVQSVTTDQEDIVVQSGYQKVKLDFHLKRDRYVLNYYYGKRDEKNLKENIRI